MPVTLPRMAKKAKRESSGQEGRPTTDVVRIEADLVRKANIIATITGASVSDLLSPVLRPFIDREFAKAVEKLQKEAKPDQPEK